MGYFPFFMEIAGKNGVIVGGGRVAARKIEKLLDFGPILTVIAPCIEESIRMQERRSWGNETASLILHERVFQMEDLKGADFVIAATDDEALNGRISDACKAEKIPVNVVDDREKCSFFFPALLRDGDLTVGISTDGKSPTAASWVREEIARALPKGLGDIIDYMGRIRPKVMEMNVEQSVRKDILEEIFLYCIERVGGIEEENEG